MLVSLILLAAASGGTPAGDANPLVEQVDDTGFYQVESPSFESLHRPDKRLAYWLAQAAIQLDPIIYDQLSSHGLDEKRLLGGLVEKPARIPAGSRAAILKYAKLFFANRGNHNSVTNQKFIPGITWEQFRSAARAARAAGAPLGTAASLDKLLKALRQPMFDPKFQPVMTNKTPGKDQDIITGSATNFYGPGVTLADLKTFKDPHPLNSRVVKRRDGTLAEEVYRVGSESDQLGPGLYAAQLGAVVDALKNAYAEVRDSDPREATVIADLMQYYASGWPTDWHTFNVDWVQKDSDVDFVNGFIETYRDARAAKGAAESLVCVRDSELNPLMQKLASNALYFEKKAPWADVYRKLDVKPPLGKAVEAIVETADFPVRTTGDNLPNEEDIHRVYGTKNFLITNASRMFSRIRGLKIVEEFQPEALERYKHSGATAEILHTAMHEIIGHGSGKLRTTAPPRETLREYYSTLEEARADLVSLWNATDPKLSELGVLEQSEVARALYDQMARSLVGVLTHYPKGVQAEEDHDRDRLMIWNWVHENGGVDLVDRDGKHDMVVLDYEKAHAAVGRLLRELMRIKGEGDYDAIKALVTTYGLHFDPALRDEVNKRFNALGIPRFSAGIYGDLALTGPENDQDVTISYPRDFLKQQVEYAKLNGTLGFGRTGQ